MNTRFYIISFRRTAEETALHSRRAFSLQSTRARAQRPFSLVRFLVSLRYNYYWSILKVLPPPLPNWSNRTGRLFDGMIKDRLLLVPLNGANESGSVTGCSGLGGLGGGSNEVGKHYPNRRASVEQRPVADRLSFTSEFVAFGTLEPPCRTVIMELSPLQVRLAGGPG